MEKKQKQSLDLRPGKRFGVGLSNENLRIGADSAWEVKVAGTLDETRTKLDFEVGKGGVITDINPKISIPKRIKAILKSHNIDDPNPGLDDEQLKMKGVGGVHMQVLSCKAAMKQWLNSPLVTSLQPMILMRIT